MGRKILQNYRDQYPNHPTLPQSPRIYNNPKIKKNQKTQKKFGTYGVSNGMFQLKNAQKVPI